MNNQTDLYVRFTYMLDSFLLCLDARRNPSHWRTDAIEWLNILIWHMVEKTILCGAIHSIYKIMMMLLLFFASW